MSDSGLTAVIFDLDGILVDTSIFHARAWANLVKGLGYTPPPDLEERVKGISRIASLKIALGDNAMKYSDEKLTELATRKNDEYTKAITDLGPDDLYEGARELFDDLKNAGIKIVLGSASKNSRPVLERLGIMSEFDAISDGFSHTHSKPHPEVFLKGAEMIHAQPHECIVVEDAAAGISAALDGGFVAVGMGKFESLQHAHCYIHSLKEIDAASLASLHKRYRFDRWTLHRDLTPPIKSLPPECKEFVTGNSEIEIRSVSPEQPYDILLAEKGDEPHIGCTEDTAILMLPNIMKIGLHIDSVPVDLTTGKITRHTQQLSMRDGMLKTTLCWTGPDGKQFEIEEQCFTDMKNRGCIYAQYRLLPVNFSATLMVTDSITFLPAVAVRQGPKQVDSSYEVLDKKVIPGAVAAAKVRGRSLGKEAFCAVRLSLPDIPDSDYRPLNDGKGIGIRGQTTLVQGTLRYFHHLAYARFCGPDMSDFSDLEQHLNRYATLSFEEARIPSTYARTHQWNELEKSNPAILDADREEKLSYFSAMVDISCTSSGQE